MKKGSIYIIRNKINEKVYIGQTTQSVHDRFMQHKKPSKSKLDYKIYKAFRRYGIENFYVEILEKNIDSENLDEKEIYYISKFNSFKKGYNSTTGGDGRTINKIEDEEKILQMAKDKKSSIQIAEIFGVSNATIFRILRKYDFKYINNLNKESLKECLNKKMSNKEMMAFFGVDARTITRNLEKNGLSKYRKKTKFRTDFDIEEFKKDFEKGIKVGILCEKYNLSQTSCYRVVKKYNMKRSVTTRE